MPLEPSEPPAPVSFWQAFGYWLKLGFISFGGPAGQIALMHQELVERRRWISEKRFLHALNYCMLLPGPEAQQLATYIGWLMHRTWGGIAAGVLFVLPSLFILIALSWIYLAYGQVPAVAGLLYGVKPAVTAIVLFAAWRIGLRVLRNAWLWAMAAAAFVAIFALNLPFPLIVLAAAVIGHVGSRIAPARFTPGGGHGAAVASSGPALIDDDTPTLAHARFGWGRFARVLAVFLALWLGAIGGLAALYGWHGALTQMAWFFTKAALMTFGGAYAVLPYVFQGAVDHYGWLSATQMIDGLALGETTPGPLIMVVSFVGFVGGWNQALFGTGALPLAGGNGGELLHLPAVVPVHPAGRALHRVDPWQPEAHRAADRHHGRGGRRDRQPRGVLRLARAVAGGGGRQVRRGIGGDRADRRRGAVPLQGRGDPGSAGLGTARAGLAAVAAALAAALTSGLFTLQRRLLRAWP